MPPKARAIRDTVAKHEGSLTASFQAVYSLRLVNAIRELTFDEIWDLIVWLPPGSPFWADSVADGDYTKATELVGWTAEAEYRLLHVNLQREANWMYASAHSKKKLPELKPIKSPLETNRNQRRGPTNADIMARQLLDAF